PSCPWWSFPSVGFDMGGRVRQLRDQRHVRVHQAGEESGAELDQRAGVVGGLLRGHQRLEQRERDAAAGQAAQRAHETTLSRSRALPPQIWKITQTPMIESATPEAFMRSSLRSVALGFLAAAIARASSSAAAGSPWAAASRSRARSGRCSAWWAG